MKTLIILFNLMKRMLLENNKEELKINLQNHQIFNWTKFFLKCWFNM